MMDFCSDKSNSQDLDLLPNIRKGELQLLREGHEHSQPHFNVDEQLEVQLRFDLGSLVDAQVLLDTQSPRDSHWDFIRQEQSGLGFQVTSEEHSSLMPRAMKQELKPFANSECWPRSPSCQEDTHLFIDAQDDVSMITDTFEVKGRSRKEQLEEKVFVDEECTQASCGEARVHSLLSQMGTGEALQFVQKSVAALECEGRAIPRKYNSSPEDKVRDEIFKESGTYLAEQTNEAEESVRLVPQTEEAKESSLSESEIILAEESAPLVSQIEDFKELMNLETDYRTVNVMDTKQSERKEKLGAESQIARETRGQRELNLSEGVGSLQEPVLSCIIEAGVEAFEIQTSNSSEVKNITQVYVNGHMNRLKSESFRHEDESSEEEHDNNGVFSGEHIAPDSFRCVKYKDDALLLMVRSEAIGVEGLSSIAGCMVPTCVSYDKNSKCIEFGNNKVDSSDTGCELLGEQTYREVNLAEKVRGPIPAKASGLVVPTVNKANLCEEGREIITQHNHTILTCDSGVSDVAHWRSEENIPCSKWDCSGVSANEAKGCVAKGSSGDAFIKAEKSEGTTVCNESNQETSEKVAAVLNTSPSSPLQCSSIDMSEKASISFDAKGLKGPTESTGVHAKMTNIKTSYFELEDKTSINLKVRSSGNYDKEADDILKMCEVSPAQKEAILTEEYPQEKMAGSLQEISQLPSARNAPDGDLGHLELDLSDAKDQMENASYVVVSVQDNEKVCLSQDTPTMEAAFLERKEVDFKSNEDRKLERISVALVGDTSLRGITLERDTSEITKEVSNTQADQGGSGQESPVCVTYENMKEHCVLEVLAKNDAEDHSTVDAMVSAAQKIDCGDCSIARGEQEHTQAGISVVISCGEVGLWQVPNTLRVGSMIKNDNDGLTKSVAVVKEYAKLGNLVLYEALPQQKIKGQLKENELGCSEFRSLCKDPHNISKGDLTVRRTDDIAEEVTTRLSVNTVSTLTETAAGFLESASPASHEFQAGNITLQDKVRKRKPSDTTRRKAKERNISRQDTGNHKTGSASASQSSPKVPIQNRDTQPTEENANFRGSKLRNASGSEKKKEASLLQIYDNLQTPPMLKKSDASASSMQRNALTNKERTFSESQQVQLRAQILVYGSLIQGGLPDEALMITVFSDTPEAGRGSGETGRSLWEKSWQIAVERIHHKSSVSTPRVLAHSFGVNLYGLPGVPPVRTLEEGSSRASGISGGGLGLGAVSNETFEDIHFLKGFSPGVRQGIEAGIHKQARKVNQPVLSNSPLLPVTSAAMCSQYSPLHESLVSPQSSGAHTDQHQAPMYPTPPGQFVLGTTHWISHPPVPGIWKAQPLQAGYNFSLPFTNNQSVMSSGLTHETAASSRKGSMSSKSLVPGNSTVHSLSTPVLGPSSAFTFAVNNTGFAQKNLLASASRSRKRKKTESEPLVMSADKLTDTIPSVEMAPPVDSDAAAALNVTGWSSGAHVNGLVTSSPLILPTCTSADSLVIAVAKNQISSEALRANQTSILPLTSLCSAASACPTAECKLLSTVECQERFMISQNLVSHLEQAKTSAEEASSRAAYSVRESESMWSQLQSGNSSGLVSDLEMQLVSSSIAITTAASVAKAAAAVATVAYEAAIQAKTIRHEALRVIEGGKDGQGCGGSEDLALRQPLPNEIENNDSFQRWEMPNSFKSIMETAKIASKKRLEAASAAKMRAQNLDSVVKAAELVTAAVSQVGAVVAMGDCVPFNMDILLEAGPEGFHRVASCGLLQDNDKSTQRGSELQIPAQCLGKGTDSGTTEKVLYKKDNDVVKETPMQEVGGANQLTEPFSGDALDLSINNTCQGNLHPDYAGNLICSKAGANEPAKGTQTEICHKEGVVTMQDPAFAIQIAKNSIIEVLSDKEGALGMWFSARVLNVEGGKALVLYDKLLSVDGCHPLKEWVNLENTAGDTPPRVRLAHPNTIISFEGMRKRRREAMGNMKWSIGDRVDAWIQDGWRDGKIVELLEENESKAKVLFQGDGGTTLIKTSKLRPSLVWSNCQWVLWTQMKQDNLRLLDSSVVLHKGETPIAKRQKIENGQLDISNSMKRNIENGQLDISNSMKRNISGESTTEIALSLSLEEKNLCVSANKLPVDGKILEVVASDVTKLTKKRKLLEATKACAPGSAACSSPGGKGIGKHEDHHLRALEFHMQSAGAIKDNAQAKQKRAFKQVVRAQEDVQIPQRKNTIQKNEKEIPYLKCRMIMQKSASSHGELASGHKKSEPKGANKKVPTVAGQLNAHRQTRNTSIALAKETTAMQKLQFPDNKYVATPVDLVGNKKQSSQPVEEEEKQPSHREKENGKQPSCPVKEFMKDIGFGMPGAELLEPRRSGRKIQPTSKLLEGLQNTFQIGRNGVAFTCEKGSKSLPKA